MSGLRNDWTSVARIIKAFVPVSMKARARYALSSSRCDELDRYRGVRKVVVALAADYGNLGDVAITYAQEAFLRSCMPGHSIVDFPISSTFTRLKALKKVVTPDDIVTIVGGGNMGDLHYTIEDCRRFVIENFQRNRIVSFPQTIDFSTSSFGRRELRKTLEVYQQHKDLHLFARESVSYGLMKGLFPKAAVYLSPDIVLMLDKAGNVEDRVGCLLCIREDNESSFPVAERQSFVSRLSDALVNVSMVDTHIGRDGLTVSEREAALFDMWKRFNRAEIVVTDRLHGMIFAAITRTPCVALQNNNYKIKATYDTWLRSSNSIVLQENYDAEETIRLVNRLRGSPSIRPELPSLTAEYDSLKAILRSTR